MKVKRIFAPDMRQAMKRVRDEIGPQAIIVSNHRIAGGVEVVAAHEQDFERAQSQFKEDRTVRQRRESQVDILTSASRRAPVSSSLEEEKAAAQQKESTLCADLTQRTPRHVQVSTARPIT